MQRMAYGNEDKNYLIAKLEVPHLARISLVG